MNVLFELLSVITDDDNRFSAAAQDDGDKFLLVRRDRVLLG